MGDPSQTNEGLLEEIHRLKLRIKELEQLESGNRLTEEAQWDRRGHIKSKPESIRASDVDLDHQELSDMIDIPSVQALLEDFYKLTHLGLAILDLKGTVLISIGWQDICAKYHRVHPQTAAYCTESDLYLAKNLRQGEYVDYKCKNHLRDVVTPLYLGGKHVGNIYIGQFFYDDEAIDIETFADQANQYGFDRESYLAALNRVPRFSRDQVKNFMDFLTKLTNMISELSYGNLKLARSMSQISGSLQESEERFRALVETTSDWIWETDSHWVYTYSSPKVKDILGYEPSEILGKTPLDLMPPDEAERVAKGMSEYVEGAKPFIGFENLNRHKDGRVVVLETSGVPIFDGHGHLTGYRGIDRDVTKRKKAEDALRATFKAAPVGLSIMKGRVFQSVNQAWCDITGYSEAEIIGHTTRTLYENEAEYERVRRELYPELLERGINSILTKHRRKDGMIRDIVLTAELLQPDAPSLETVVVIEDITDRKHREVALRESEKDLRTIFDNTYDAIFVHDLDWRIVDCNQKMLDLYRVTKEQARCSTIVDDFSASDNLLDSLGEQWDRVLAGETLSFEWKAKRPNDGFTFDVDVALKLVGWGDARWCWPMSGISPSVKRPRRP
ncbi:PAS domain S-box-containing protein [Syntrophus gentianae]|uniref:PAS domain S-box-containing protein n=1 Tax=Syntrophus gentianae TaxID=43775 RepID=A0A1H7UYC4_9BACT|nr:PAS domain S-box protein [Syntrophus gentianae]SEM01972.1 PAS domain S-box-containing protein [Syntrophus gentianae]